MTTDTHSPDDTAALTERRRASLERVRRWAFWLDDAVKIPGTRFGVGLDGLIGLIPGIGDAAGLAMSTMPIVEAARLKAPRPVLKKMALNSATDFVLGLVPLVGDVADVAWRANRRNLGLLEKWLHDELTPADQAKPRDTWIAVALIAGSVAAIALLMHFT
jgi:hypothetical protein